MSSKWFIRACAVWALGLASLPLAAQRWQLQYFYDKDDSALNIVDLQFPSAARGVAVGTIEGKTRTRHVAIVTADGGARWEVVPLREQPLSLFFLNENLGWMVTTKGIWVTAEAGKSWRKLPKSPRGAQRVYFLDEKTGFAVGVEQMMAATHDGGNHWTPVPAAKNQPGDRHYSAYTWIAFATPKLGIVTGWNIPPDPRAPRRPNWMDPEAIFGHKALPHLALSLQTRDGGQVWTPGSSSTFGVITRVRFAGSGPGLGLVEYAEAFTYPSEVFWISNPSGKSESLYRDPRFTVTDIWLSPQRIAYLAGVINPGILRTAAPGKVQVLQNRDGTWHAIDVDYRAVAKRVVLAGTGDRLWMATDAGMILKLDTAASD